MRKIFTTFFISFLAANIFAQNQREQSVIMMRKIQGPIKVDGLTDEPAWQQVEAVSGFYQNFPTDSLPAIAKTEVKMMFDDDFLYISAVCYNEGRDYIVASLKRDYEFSTTESFNLYVDTYNDLTNGFTFGISPLGVQREGLFSEREQVATDWDNKWYSGVTNYPDKWIVEMAIPFKTLRYNKDNRQWNINFLRYSLKHNERSTWVRVPQQFRPNNILYSGKMIWEDLPPKPGANVSVIPYLSGATARDFEEGEPTDYTFEAGFDAKIGVTPALNLDLTFNPDFSQVEVDEQVTNLDRFEIFFPERRQFFLENSDLFALAGFPGARPFFSRRIGIAKDTSGNNVQTPILYGARLSGKLDRNWRIGLMNMQTQKDDDLDIIGQNYTVATVQRTVFAGSNLSAILVNRQSVNYKKKDEASETSRYNRVWGFEYNFATGNNKWEGEAFYHRSENPGRDTENFAHGAFLGYNTRNLGVFWFHNLVGENYNAEVGFVPRTGFARGELSISPVFYPTNGVINTIETEIGAEYTTDTDFNVLDQEFYASVEISYANTSEFNAGVERNTVTLQDPFDPTNSDGLELPAGSEYTWDRFGIGYASDQRKLFNYSLFTAYGGFYNGNLLEVEAELNYRYQPYGNLALAVTYNNIALPKPFEDTDFFLIGPRIDLTFTDQLFLTTFIQFNEQNDNLNINTRFQWRFKPVSDLFIVYTDNYLPQNLKVKNRALVLKLSYWLNI
ncbi:MAG: carbohydrate binding family 9 domain-containing protein [Cytophagales bacterium]|nr:carbohydrate binding family 9 domain-containing protein [Cytophagales bacterium]